MVPFAALLALFASPTFKALASGRPPSSDEMGSLIGNVVQALLDQGDAMATQLDRLEAKLDLLAGQDYRSTLGAAMRQLGDAQQPWRAVEERVLLLRGAMDNLRRAAEAAPHIAARGEVETLIASTWLLCGSPPDARVALERAESACSAALSLSEQSIYSEPLPSAWVSRWPDNVPLHLRPSPRSLMRSVGKKVAGDRPSHSPGLAWSEKDGARMPSGSRAPEVCDRLAVVQVARQALGVHPTGAPIPALCIALPLPYFEGVSDTELGNAFRAYFFAPGPIGSLGNPRVFGARDYPRVGMHVMFRGSDDWLVQRFALSRLEHLPRVTRLLPDAVRYASGPASVHGKPLYPVEGWQVYVRPFGAPPGIDWLLSPSGEKAPQ